MRNQFKNKLIDVGVVGIGALNGMCVCVDCLDLVRAVIISFGQEVRRQLAPLPQC